MFDRGFCFDTNSPMKCHDDSLSSVYSYAVVLVAFITRNLRFRDFETIRKLSLRNTTRYTETNQYTADVSKRFNRSYIPSSHAIIDLDLFAQLLVKRDSWLDTTFNFLVAKIHSLKCFSLCLDHSSILLQSLDCVLVFGIAANHLEIPVE